jgi:hypothetical protein
MGSIQPWYIHLFPSKKKADKVQVHVMISWRGIKEHHEVISKNASFAPPNIHSVKIFTWKSKKSVKIRDLRWFRGMLRFRWLAFDSLVRPRRCCHCWQSHLWYFDILPLLDANRFRGVRPDCYSTIVTMTGRQPHDHSCYNRDQGSGVRPGRTVQRFHLQLTLQTGYEAKGSVFE